MYTCMLFYYKENRNYSEVSNGKKLRWLFKQNGLGFDKSNFLWLMATNENVQFSKIFEMSFSAFLDCFRA